MRLKKVCNGLKQWLKGSFEAEDSTGYRITQEHFYTNNFGLIQLLASVLVMFSHAFPLTGRAGEPLAVLTNAGFNFGNLSVAVLFIISGFLVMHSLQRSKSTMHYLKNRVLRIFPEYMVSLLFAILVLGAATTTLSLREYFGHPRTWTYLQNISLFSIQWDLPGVFENNVFGSSINGSVWTLPYQFGLYVVLAAVWVIIQKRGCYLVLFIASVFVYLFQSLLFPHVRSFMMLPVVDWYYLTMYFLAGTTAYLYKDKIILTRTGFLVAAAGLLTLFSLGAYRVAMATFGTYLILYLAYRTKPVRFFMMSLSYGIYIYAFPMQQLYACVFAQNASMLNPYVSFVILLPVVTAIAWLSERMVSKPLNMFFRKLENRWMSR